jgi:hypothetical protein
LERLTYYACNFWNIDYSGDTGTVTNTMLAGSIADSKLLQITTAGKVATSALTGTLFTLGTTAIAALQQ